MIFQFFPQDRFIKEIAILNGIAKRGCSLSKLINDGNRGHGK